MENSSVPISKSIDLENAYRQFFHEVCFSWLPKFVTLFLTRVLGNSMFAVDTQKQPSPSQQSTQNTIGESSLSNDSQQNKPHQISFKPLVDELFLEFGEGLTVYFLVVMLASLLAKTFAKPFGVPNYELAGLTHKSLKEKIGKKVKVGFKNKKEYLLTNELFHKVTRLKFLSVLGATAFGVFEQFCLPFYRNWLSAVFLKTGSFFEISGLPETDTPSERETQRLYVKDRAERFMKWALGAFLAAITGISVFSFRGRKNSLEAPKMMDKIFKVVDLEKNFGFSRMIFALTLGMDCIAYPLAARKDIKSGKNPELFEVITRACMWVVPCALFLKDQMQNICTWIIGRLFGVRKILMGPKETFETNQVLDFNRVNIKRIEKLPDVQKLDKAKKERLFKQIKRAKNIYVYLIALSIGIGVNIFNFFRTRDIFKRLNQTGQIPATAHQGGITPGKYL